MKEGRRRKRKDEGRDGEEGEGGTRDEGGEEERERGE